MYTQNFESLLEVNLFGSCQVDLSQIQRHSSLVLAQAGTRAVLLRKTRAVLLRKTRAVLLRKTRAVCLIAARRASVSIFRFI